MVSYSAMKMKTKIQLWYCENSKTTMLKPRMRYTNAINSTREYKKKVNRLIPSLLPSAAALRRAIMAHYEIISYETLL